MNSLAKPHEDRFTSFASDAPWSTLIPDINALRHREVPSLHRPTPVADMSLVSGPGRAGMGNMPEEMQLFVDKHVRYIQSLDTVRTSHSRAINQQRHPALTRSSAKTSLSTGSPSICV